MLDYVHLLAQRHILPHVHSLYREDFDMDMQYTDHHACFPA